MKHLYLIIFIVYSNFSFSQDNDIQIGTGLGQLRQTQGGFYDYSDPESVNIKVSIWGFVKFPGRYIIPSYCGVIDLISFAGGPSEDATLDDVRVLREGMDSSQNLIKLNYNDLLWNKEVKSIEQGNVDLIAGDVLLVTGEQRYYLRDYLQMGLSIFSAIISLAILIINIAQ